MKMLLLTCAISVLPSLALAGQDEDKTSTLRFPGSGFSIAPLKGNTKETPHQALSLLLAPTDGFAPNVNVVIQVHQGTFDQYIQQSTDQFKAAGLTVIKDKGDKDSHTWEFSGTVQGKNLHFYTRAEPGKGTMYLATATALQSQWDKHGDDLKACVDSFKTD